MQDATSAAEALRSSGLLSGADVARAEALAAERGMPLDRAVVALGLLAEDQVLWFVAERAGVDLVFPSEDAVDADLVARFPADELRRHDALPMLQDEDGAIVVAFPSPPDESVVEEFARAAGTPVRPALASAPRLRRVLTRLLGAGATDPALVSARDPSGVTAFYRHLTACFGNGCDELRFEPVEGGLRVRYRRQGRLHEAEREPPEIGPAVASRARMLAGIAPPGAPAADRATFRTMVGGRSRRLGLSVVPSLHGECVVLATLPPVDVPARLEDWKLPSDVAAWISERLLGDGETPRALHVRSDDDELRLAFLRAVAAAADDAGLAPFWAATRDVASGAWTLVAGGEGADDAAASARADLVVTDEPQRAFVRVPRVVTSSRTSDAAPAAGGRASATVEIAARWTACGACTSASPEGCDVCRGTGRGGGAVEVTGRVDGGSR